MNARMDDPALRAPPDFTDREQFHRAKCLWLRHTDDSAGDPPTRISGRLGF
jgi:hypothetical protein